MAPGPAVRLSRKLGRVRATLVLFVFLVVPERAWAFQIETR